MSGRPNAPSYTIPIWAPDANYGASADPWSVTPTKVDHPGRGSVGFTPKAGVPAQCMNLVVSDAYATDQLAKDSFAPVWTYAGQVPALSFPSAFSTSVGMRFAKFNPITREWFATNTASNDDLRVTKQVGLWPGATSIPVGQRGALAFWDCDFDTTGNMLGVSASSDCDISRTAGGTWVKHTGVIGINPCTKPNIRYESVSGNWVIATGSTGLAPGVVTSSNLGVSWTGRTPPSMPAGTIVVLGNDGAGNLLMQGFLGTNTYFSVSSDGGVTWSSTVTVALGFTWSTGTTSNVLAKPVWTGTNWVALATDLSAHTMILSSTDGVTWTTASFTSVFHSLEAAGQLLIMSESAIGGGFALSIDNGATWQWSDWALPSTTDSVLWIAFSGVRFVVFTGATTSFAYVGTGLGTGLGNVT